MPPGKSGLQNVGHRSDGPQGPGGTKSPKESPALTKTKLPSIALLTKHPRSLSPAKAGGRMEMGDGGRNVKVGRVVVGICEGDRLGRIVVVVVLGAVVVVVVVVLVVLVVAVVGAIVGKDDVLFDKI